MLPLVGSINQATDALKLPAGRAARHFQAGCRGRYAQCGSEFSADTLIRRLGADTPTAPSARGCVCATVKSVVPGPQRPGPAGSHPAQPDRERAALHDPRPGSWSAAAGLPAALRMEVLDPGSASRPIRPKRSSRNSTGSTPRPVPGGRAGSGAQSCRRPASGGDCSDITYRCVFIPRPGWRLFHRGAAGHAYRSLGIAVEEKSVGRRSQPECSRARDDPR